MRLTPILVALASTSACSRSTSVGSTSELASGSESESRSASESVSGSGSSSAYASPSASSSAPAASRPYALHVPPHAPPAPIPLLLFLHGYGSSGSEQVRAFGLEPFADAHGFALAYPDGTVDSHGKRFWSATDACCNFDDARVDDVAYVRTILDDAASKVSVDPERVFVFGFSNGGFLAQRVACDLAPRVAAVVSLAGAAWADASRCTPSEPVSVLEIHGDSDETVRPDGGSIFDLPGRRYPSVLQTLATWAAKDACAGSLGPTGRRVDFDRALLGRETQEKSYAGCPAGVSVAWWDVTGGGHLLNPTPAGIAAAWEWMTRHPKAPAKGAAR